MTRKIIHIDMDAFYASIEQRDFPELRGKPVVVGGDPRQRGVVAAASYEARKFGISSAMPSVTACRLCPQAIFMPPRFDVYKSVSQQLHEIFSQYTDLIEPLALDEAYLDVTANKLSEKLAVPLAKRIIAQIYAEMSLSASAGVSYNKFLAKLASGWQKPMGLTVITPERAEKFLEKLPIGRFYCVGKATEKKMLSLGIRCGKDLKDFGLDRLTLYFGKKRAAFFDAQAHGIDERPVVVCRESKSIGKELTYQQDLVCKKEIEEEVLLLAQQVCIKMQANNLRGRTIQLKVRYAHFKTVTRSHTLLLPTNTLEDVGAVAVQLLALTEAGVCPVRLLGVSLASFDERSAKRPLYVDLFGDLYESP